MVVWATAVAHTTITDAVDGSVVSVRGKPPRFRKDARVAALTDGDMVAWRESETVLASAEWPTTARLLRTAWRTVLTSLSRLDRNPCQLVILVEIGGVHKKGQNAATKGL